MPLPSVHEPPRLVAQTSVHGFAPEPEHGVPGVFPAQEVLSHVAAASAVTQISGNGLTHLFR